jgi:ribose/xylose/arabinose/galactoside ABC-type transport system permease subunit
MSAETVPQSLSSKHQASTWSKLLAVREFGSFAALIIMILVIAIFIPQFSNWENIVNITRNFSFVGIVALGMTLVILTGGIDLSVGSVWGMTAVITASLMALIGQRPYKMGVQSIISLKEATEGKKIENVDTGVDVVEASKVDQFIKK